MSTLSVCASCRGFVPASARACPHCDAPAERSRLGRAARACAKVAAGGAVAMTLMACYGGPPQAYRPAEPPPKGQCPEEPGQGSEPGSPTDPDRNCSQGQQPTSTIATGQPEEQYATPPPGS
jgi:hypothetical protein